MPTYRAIALCVFLCCCTVGAWVAGRAALQNDEIYSQQRGVQKLSYSQIVQGQILEANNTPVFYVTQKLFLDLMRFRLNDPWPGDEMDICNGQGQLLMRALPVASMSLAITLMFYFFARRYGLAAGVAAASLMLTSPMTWTFWVQARPYALWVLLTTIQMLAFMRIVEDSDHKRAWRLLAACHALLCLTSPFGMVQTGLITLLLRRHYIPLAVLPGAAGIYYFCHAPHFPFRVPHPAWELFTANFPVEYAVVIAAGAFFLNTVRRNEGNRLLLGVAALCGVSLAFIGYYVRLNTQGTAGFGLSPRYFIFLVPVGTVAVVSVVGQIWELGRKQIWLRLIVAEAVAGLVVMGALRTYVALRGILL